MRLSILCVFWLSLAAPAWAVDENSYEAIAAASQEDMAAGRFEVLELDAERYRKSEGLTEGGSARLAAFYRGLKRSLAEDGSASASAATDRFENGLRRWVNAYPRSGPAHVMLARVAYSRAWLARGNGYASTVTDAGWLLFSMQLRVAKNRLDEAKAYASDDPEWHALNLELLLGASAPNEDFETAAKTALDLRTNYGPVWATYLRKKSVKWGGDRKLYDDAVADLVNRTKAEFGQSFYALGYLELAENNPRAAFEGSLVDWPRMKAGFEDLTRRFPSRYNLNAFGAFACQFADMPALRAVQARIGDRRDPEPWRKRGYTFEACARAAAQEQLNAEDEAYFSKPRPAPEERLAQQAISLDASEDLAAGRFEKLDTTHARLLADRSTTPSGASKLHFFHTGLLVSKLIYKQGARVNEPDFAPLERQIENWLAVSPKSTPALILRARVLAIKAAYVAGPRIPGQENKLTIEGKALVAKSREALTSIRDIASIDPEWWTGHLAAERAGGADDAALNALAGQALAVDANYPGIQTEILRRVSATLKRYDAFLQSVVLPAVPSKSEAYAQSYLWLAGKNYMPNLLDLAKPDWPLLKTGLDSVVARYPSDWNLNAYANLACMAGDKATVALLFERLQDRIIDDAWNDWRAPGRCRAAG